MSTNQPPPQWISDLVTSTRARIGIGDEWSIVIVMADVVAGDDPFDGSCDMRPEYLNALLMIPGNIKNDAGGRAIVVHEVTHVLLADVEWIVSRILGRVSKGERRVLRQIYDDVVERTVQRLTRAIDRP